MLFKEDFIPAGAEGNKFLFNLAPLLAFAPAFCLFAVVPVGPEVTFWGKRLEGMTPAALSTSKSVMPPRCHVWQSVTPGLHPVAVGSPNRRVSPASTSLECRGLNVTPIWLIRPAT